MHLHNRGEIRGNPEEAADVPIDRQRLLGKILKQTNFDFVRAEYGGSGLLVHSKARSCNTNNPDKIGGSGT